MAVVAVIAGGVLWLTSGGSESRITMGREILWYAVIGILLAFSSWIIVNTILDTLGFRLPINMARWNDFSICQGINNQTGQASTPAASIPTGPITPTAGIKLSETAARDFLLANGIGVNNTTPCPAGMKFQDYKAAHNGQGCTSLEGIKQSTLDAVVAFKNACGCLITITGGTELGHTASHASGDKVDIDATPQVTSFIRSKYTLAGTRDDGAILYRSPNGTIFADEGNHFDTTIPI